MTIKISDAKDYWNSAKSAVRHPWSMLSALRAKHAMQAIVGFSGTRDGFTVYDMDVEDFDKWGAFSEWVQGHWRHYQRNAEASVGLGAGAGILIAVERDGTVRVVTHSVKKADCDHMLEWTDRWVWPDISVIPFRSLFGWSNNGIPKWLTPEEEASLSASDLQKLERFRPSGPAIQKADIEQ